MCTLPYPQLHTRQPTSSSPRSSPKPFLCNACKFLPSLLFSFNEIRDFPCLMRVLTYYRDSNLLYLIICTCVLTTCKYWRHSSVQPKYEYQYQGAILISRHNIVIVHDCYCFCNDISTGVLLRRFSIQDNISLG